MSRNLLSVRKLDAFKAWLDNHPNLEWRDTSKIGDRYCLMQVRSKSGGWDRAWLGIYVRHHMPEHVTVDRRLEATVREFIAQSRRASKAPV